MRVDGRNVLLMVLLCVLMGLSVNAENPVVPNVGMADPHVRIFDGKAYLYTTRDADPKARGWDMPEWTVWSSDDLVDWTLETVIKPTDTYMGASQYCWASDAVCKNGMYYFYFSNRNIDTGVMVGSTPVGPFKDALDKPLLPQELTPIKEYDPTVLIDDDGSAYIAFGHWRSSDPDYYYCIAKLGEDMISLAEKPREIIVVKANVGNDKPTLHKRGDLYYLSCGSKYGTAKNVYGPYTWRGNSGNEEYGLQGQAHGNYFTWNNQWFHIWCKFITDNKTKYRDSAMSYLHYKDNGEMVTDTAFLDAYYDTGVGQYSAWWKRIEAEWYMAAEKVTKRECPNGGFEIQDIKDGGFLKFPNVRHLEANMSMTFCVSSANGGTIEVRQGAVDGALLGTCKVANTGGWKTYKKRSCRLTNTAGTKDIYLVFKGGTGGLLNIDWFAFDSTD